MCTEPSSPAPNKMIDSESQARHFHTSRYSAALRILTNSLHQSRAQTKSNILIGPNYFEMHVMSFTLKLSDKNKIFNGGFGNKILAQHEKS